MIVFDAVQLRLQHPDTILITILSVHLPSTAVPPYDTIIWNCWMCERLGEHHSEEAERATNFTKEGIMNRCWSMDFDSK